MVKVRLCAPVTETLNVPAMFEAVGALTVYLPSAPVRPVIALRPLKVNDALVGTGAVSVMELPGTALP